VTMFPRSRSTRWATSKAARGWGPSRSRSPGGDHRQFGAAPDLPDRGLHRRSTPHPLPGAACRSLRRRGVLLGPDAGSGDLGERRPQELARYAPGTTTGDHPSTDFSGGSGRTTPRGASRVPPRRGTLEQGLKRFALRKGCRRARGDRLAHAVSQRLSVRSSGPLHDCSTLPRRDCSTGPRASRGVGAGVGRHGPAEHRMSFHQDCRSPQHQPPSRAG
jgi:hypothetical protein